MSDLAIYTIPGLGFDQRIFSKLNLPGHDLHHLNWIKPRSNEPIHIYAARLAEKISHPPEHCILVGHSFGGIMAQEIAAVLPVKKIILISSIKSGKEKPLNFRSVATLGLHKWFTKRMTLNTFRYWGKYFGYGTDELQQLFRDMVAGQSDEYLKWALYQLSIWEGVGQQAEIGHIHGEMDKTFPVKLIKEPVLKVENGTHMMVFNKPAVINELILSQF